MQLVDTCLRRIFFTRNFYRTWRQRHKTEAKKLVCCKYKCKLSDVRRYIAKFCNYSFTVVQLYTYGVESLSYARKICKPNTQNLFHFSLSLFLITP